MDSDLMRWVKAQADDPNANPRFRELLVALEAAREDAERYRWLRERMVAEEIADEAHAMLALRVVGPIAKRPRRSRLLRRTRRRHRPGAREGWAGGGEVSAVKYRIHKWGHVLTGEVMYGIQGKPAGESRYLHCCEGTEPLIFKTRDGANAKLRQIRAKQAAREMPSPTPPDPGHE